MLGKDDRASRLAERGRLRQRLSEIEQELGIDRAPETAEALTLDRALSEIIVSHASDLISVHSANGDYLYASPSATRLFGWLPAELVGQSAYPLFHPDDIARVASDHARHAEGERGGVRYRLRCRDGSYRWVETNSESHPSGRIVSITRDVDGEVRSELTGRLGELANLLAHEINNPLTVAVATVDRLPASQQSRELLYALHRIADVMRDLTSLAALGKSGPSRLRIGDVLRESIQLFGAPRRASILVSGDTTLEITVDTPRFYQLVHTILLTFLHGRADPPPVELSCALVNGRAELAVTGSVDSVTKSLKSDLGAVLRGETHEPAIPLQIAEGIAQFLGASWSANVVDRERLRIVVALPVN